MKEFMIFRADKKSEKQPDYRLSSNIDGKFVNIGAGWSRTSDKGTKFISCKLSDAYQDLAGWHLEKDVQTTSDGSPMPNSDVPGDIL
jgi:uncharacterized protein (DUF736 family)